MSKRTAWTALKNRRGDTEARRRGHKEAKDAFDLGARVRVERERLGLTQTELAESMGTHPAEDHTSRGRWSHPKP